MRHILLLVLSVFALSLTSCRDDFEFEPSTGGLEFSKDTVYLDTVFTNIGSSTYRLKVYNRSDKDIKIPSIKLGRDNSKYRLMVDGMPGTSFNNVELMAKDSMFVFIETTASIADANPDDFLYTDEIQFTSINGMQKVNLVTLIQDAVFIYPNRPVDTGIKETLRISGLESDIQGHELTTAEELHWTNQKPYVVYGYALVPNNRTLVIDPGVRVHFHAESGLIVDREGTLAVNGAPSATEALENEVIFEGDRLEPDFADTPGQWGSVLMFSVNDNFINHLTLKNATVGLLMQRLDLTTTDIPKLTINNSQIYNCANIGLLARRGNITSTNLVANNCGQASIALTQGGEYLFKHATIANYFNAYNQVPLLMNDYLETEDAVYVSDLNAVFENCIMYGSNNYGISLENISEGAAAFNYRFKNCLIRFNDVSGQLEDEPLYNFEGANYTGIIIAKGTNNNNPKFVNARNNNLDIEEDSAAKDMGATDLGITVDIAGRTRSTPPDMGAYEYTPGAD
jgi:hypothetical protein